MGDAAETEKIHLSTGTDADYYTDTISTLFYKETPRYRSAIGRQWGHMPDADARQYMQELLSTVDDYCDAAGLTPEADEPVEHDQYPYVQFRTVERLEGTGPPVLSGQVQYYRGKRLHPRLPRPRGRDCLDLGVRYRSAADDTGLDDLKVLLDEQIELTAL